MKVTVKVDQNLCIGSGSCVVVAAEHFEFNDDGKALVKRSANEKAKGSKLVLDVKQSDKEKLLTAARSCPAQAITILDEHGKKLYP